MRRDHYQPRGWSIDVRVINQWGRLPPPRLLLTGFPIAKPSPGRPSRAMSRPRSRAG